MLENIPELCEVCTEPLDKNHNAVCRFCGRFFHLTWDTRLEIKDCGRFDIDEVSLAMYFTCDACIGGKPPPPGRGGRD